MPSRIAAFSDITPTCYRRTQWTSRLPTLPLLARQGRCHGLFLVFICNRALTVQTSYLLDRHFLGPLVTKSKYLLGIYFCLYLFMFPGCCILLQVWGMGQKENPGNSSFCHSSDPKVPSLSAFSLHLSECLFYR